MAIGTPTDAILTSVIGNRLDAVSREIGQTMLRTSRSPIFSEARDFVTAIFDRDLRLVAQTAYIPVLMGSTPYAMRAIAESLLIVESSAAVEKWTVTIAVCAVAVTPTMTRKMP